MEACSAVVRTGLLVLLLAACLISAQRSMADFVDDMLAPTRYDNRVRPGVDSGKPVIVYLDMFVNSISSIDEVKMEYTINIYMRQRWIDDRLTYTDPDGDITLNYNLFDRLWVPDLFIKNEKKATFHTITVPNRLLKLSPNGQVYYSQRLSLTLNCNMHLRFYPMDNQTCHIQLESYGYTTKDIVFRWKEEGEPVQMTDPLQLPEFQYKGVDLGDCTVEYITGSFTCIYASIKLMRQFEYYLIQTFVPSILIVALSWVSFWIDIHAVPARVTLGLLTVLTTTTQSTGISSRLPRVSYIKAIDVWMTCCLVFVFGALIEYSIVNVLARKSPGPGEEDMEERAEEESNNGDWAQRTSVHQIPPAEEKQTNGSGSTTVVGDSGDVTREHLDMNSVCVQITAATSPLPNGGPRNRKPDGNRVADMARLYGLDGKKKKKNSVWRRMKKNPALAIDMVSRVFFPSVFIVFNIVYWNVYKGNNGED